MLKTNIKSKKDLLEKIKEVKVLETENYRYIAERFEQVDSWENCYEMRYEIKRKKLTDINNPDISACSNWETLYTERVQDNFLNIEDNVF